jgi:hypothetical protein
MYSDHATQVEEFCDWRPLSHVERLYVQYRALNRVFPVRALQEFCLFSSAVLTMDGHCLLSPTEAGVPCHFLDVADYFK